MNDSTLTSVAFDHAPPLAQNSVAPIAAFPAPPIPETHLKQLTLH